MIGIWHGGTLCVGQETHHFRLQEVDTLNGAPSLRDAGLEAPIDTLLWPLEQLALLPFELPLPQVRLVDDEILGQELADRLGDSPADWWLNWQAFATERGVTGLAFGMPNQLRLALQASSDWSHCRFVGADAWPRLESFRQPDVRLGAVVDADSEGIFFGVFSDASWLGMRRLNRVGSRDVDEMAMDIVGSLKSMGLAAEAPVCGRVDAQLAAGLGRVGLTWQGEVSESLPDRLDATLDAALQLRGADRPLGPNFRRGEWRVRDGEDRAMRPWRRSLVLAGLAGLLLLAVQGYALYGLERQVSGLRAGIEAAFHRGLPDEKVMLDPLAQLRAAAGQSVGNAGFLLWQLQAVAELASGESGVEVDKIEYADAMMRLEGSAKDFAAVNRVRDQLGRLLGTAVQLKDTEVEGGGRVRFRLQWS